MWENKEDSIEDGQNSSFKFIDKTDQNDPCSLLENYESIFFPDSSSFVDPFKKSIKEATFQVPNLRYSDFSVTEPTEIKSLTTEQSSNTETKKKRGRGRGSRGSYKPRGRSRFIGSSYGNSYGMINPVQKVCINPEILRRLGYPIPSPTEYYDTSMQPNFTYDERGYSLWNPMNLRLCMPIESQNLYGYQNQPMNFSQINQNLFNKQQRFVDTTIPVENSQPPLQELISTNEKISLDADNSDVELSYMYVNQQPSKISLNLESSDNGFDELKNERIPVETLIDFPNSVINEKKDSYDNKE